MGVTALVWPQWPVCSKILAKIWQAGITWTKVEIQLFSFCLGETGDLRRARTLNLNKIWMFWISPFFVCAKWQKPWWTSLRCTFSEMTCRRTSKIDRVIQNAHLLPYMLTDGQSMLFWIYFNTCLHYLDEILHAALPYSDLPKHARNLKNSAKSGGRWWKVEQKLFTKVFGKHIHLKEIKKTVTNYCWPPLQVTLAYFIFLTSC